MLRDLCSLTPTSAKKSKRAWYIIERRIDERRRFFLRAYMDAQNISNVNIGAQDLYVRDNFYFANGHVP
jgi:hypothetical protein